MSAPPLFVRQQRTIVTLDDLAPAIVSAFNTYAMPVEAIDIAIVFGKLIAECGWPGPAQCCWNWNIGNLRGSDADTGLYTVLANAVEFAPPDRLPRGAMPVPTPAHMVAPPGTVAFLPTNPSESQRFTAFADLVHGCRRYAEKLHDRFTAAYRAFERADSTPEDVVAGLQIGHYFTGDPAAYLRNMKSGVAWALPRVQDGVATLIEAPTTDPGGRFEGGAVTPTGWADRAERDAADE